MTPPLVLALAQPGRTFTPIPPSAAAEGILLNPVELGFVERVRPHVPAMVAAARRILKSDDLAWDAVQEALQRLWLGGRLPDNAAPVLLHWVKKASLHLRRCQARRTDHEFVRAARSTELCCEADPLSILESDDQIRHIRAAIRELSEEYRCVLELVEVDGESYEAIAKRLGLPVGTVRSRLSRARKQLREKLGSQFSAA